MKKSAMFIVTQDAQGNDRIFAGCENFKATWTLQADKARKFSDFQLALTVARQFDGFRIHSADADLGPKVVTTGSPLYLHKII